MAAFKERELIVDPDTGGLRDLLYVNMLEFHALADWCKDRHNRGEITAGKYEGDDLRVLAEIPMSLVEKYCIDKGITFAEWMRNNDHATAMYRDPGLRDFTIDRRGI